MKVYDADSDDDVGIMRFPGAAANVLFANVKTPISNRHYPDAVNPFYKCKKVLIVGKSVTFS